MERALKTVQHRVPSAIEDVNSARDALIAKFRNDVIGNITDFRKLSKIATSISNVGMKEAKAKEALRKIFDPRSKVGIDEVYAEHFEIRYDERKIAISIDSIYEYLEDTASDGEIIVGADLRTRLLRLKNLIERILKA